MRLQFYGETQKKMLDAAKAMKLSAKDLLDLKVIDEIIPEPLGGAHRDRNLILSNVRESISKNLEIFKEMSFDDILNQRKNKFFKNWKKQRLYYNLENLSSLRNEKNTIDQFFKNRKYIYLVGVSVLLVLF